MRKIITYLLLSYGITTASFAQQDSTLLLLDKTEINSDVLYPYLANDSTASWLKLGGDTNSISNSKRWKQLYAEYVYYNLESHLLPSLDSIIKQAEYEINYNRRVPLMIMDINYHVFKSHAIDSGLVIIENGKFMDNPDRTESLYIEKQLFVAAPFMEKMMNDTLTFFISSDFYFSSSSLPQTIEIDFGDGVGFRSVTMEQTIKINYSSIKNNSNFSPTITVKVSKGSNSLLSSSTMKASTCLGNFPPQDDIWNLYTSQPFSTNFSNPYPVDPLAGNFARANAYVKYGNGHPVGEVHKPIVFVEGIDFGRDFSSNTIQNGDFGWCAFWGRDTDFEEFQHSPTILNQLLANGYDVFLLDFRDGAEFIERNAMTLVELLRLIRLNNQFNNINVVPEPTVVVGASMGGQVARYALAYMEQNNMEHCAREFISFDSPHKGANIPISLQEWIEFFAYNGPGGGSQGAKDNLNLKLDRPAAKQLLTYHHDNSIGGFNVSERAAYQNTINAIGYPNKLRKVAIANGSGHAIKQPNLNSGDLLLKTDWSPWGCLNARLVQGDCYAMPNHFMFAGKVPKNTLGAGFCFILTPLLCNLCVNSNISFDTETVASGSNLLPLDNAPGGWRNTALTIEEEYRDDPDAIGDITADPQGHGLSPNQSFIPTISALDINTTDLLFNVLNNINLNSPNPNLTPFEAIYIPSNGQNQQHVQLDPSPGGNLAWALNEILDTENKLKSPLTSTSPNNGVFNYGRKESRFISSVIIGNGGQLNINANLPTDYGLATTPIPSTGVNPPVAGSSLLMETCECGEVVVEIDAGGEFILGENTPNNKATVLFHEKSTLHIKAGGKLIIKNNSRLVIEKGAKLIYEPGAEIQLLGDEAVLEIQGELEVKDNATFTFTYPNANSGYLKFNVPFNPCQSNPNWACPVITAGQNSKMELRGADKNDKILEIAGEDMLIPEDMAFFRLWFGKAEFTTPGARLSLASTNYRLTDATFVGTVNNRGVVVWGNQNSFIVRCNFENVKIWGGLWAKGSRLNVFTSNFTNGAYVETTGRGVLFNDVNFNRTASYIQPTPTPMNGWINSHPLKSIQHIVC
ncbi:MAG: hypothetical protein RQ875_02430 [Vicingaceae bacterium]|nr:hypothetical protein [Vicingaceae bacterium]